VQRMGSLIDALLQLSRVTRTEVQRERVDLSQLATLVFNELQAASPERDVLFLALPGVLAEADPRLVRIAFENLIGNAYKFTSRTEAGRIEFGSEPGRFPAAARRPGLQRFRHRPGYRFTHYPPSPWNDLGRKRTRPRRNLLLHSRPLRR